MSRRVAAALATALLAALAGCGLGAGRGPQGVRLTVTRDFGSRTIGSASAGRAPGGETVMRFLQRRFPVRTRYGGGFVQAIGGLAGGVEAGRRIDWFYYVNGIEASRGAAATPLHAGDRVWWDRHDWGAAMSVPAVVGSFPEPFRSGSAGKRLPVATICAPGAGAACDRVGRKLERAGVSAARSPAAGGPGRHTLRLLVGPWRRLRDDALVRRLEDGPSVSGVFARPAPDGRSLLVLDARGRSVRRLGAGSGLVAATATGGGLPVWVVTGTDSAGVLAAADALDERSLGGRFALALTADRPLALPASRASATS